MFKKISASLFAIVAVLSMCVSVSAYESENVFDYLEYLTEDEVVALQGTIDGIATTHKLDVVIVITDDTEGKSSMEYADDYYDYNGFGLDDEFSGLLMLINMDEREVWFSTTGKAIRIFTDFRISSMVNSSIGYLGDADFYGACEDFLSDVNFYAILGIPDNQHTVDDDIPHYYTKETYFDKVLKVAINPLVYIVTIAIAVIVTLIIASGNKGKNTVTNKTYETDGSFKLNVSNDVFLRESVTKVRIESSSSGGSGGGSGRSSSHSGSSGRSHGGGGGRF